MAHALARFRIPGVRVDSAGTHASDRGEPMDPRALAALTKRRLPDLGRRRSRRVLPEDLDHFDLVLAMDADNLEYLREMASAEQNGRLRLFLDFVPGLAGQDVPDPYYGNADGFARVLDLCEAGIAGLRSTLDGVGPAQSAEAWAR